METNTSPTPLEDNRQNSRDDLMYSALDKVMNNSEQTYEDFLSSFTYLKQAGSKERNNQQGKMTAAIKNSVPTERKADGIRETVRGNITDLPKDNQGDITQLSDDIEEEVLIEGDSSSRLTQTKVIRTGTLVKFENFVANSVDDLEELTEEDDLEELTEEDDLEELTEELCEGYTASFGAGNFGGRDPRLGMISNICSSEKEQSSKTLQENAAGTSADVCDTVDTPLSLDENSTDKLLMHFLADLQNELNEGKPNERPEMGDTTSCMDIQNFLNKDKKQKEVASEDVNFDDDDTMNLLQDDSTTRQIKVKITEEELKEQGEFDEAEEKERKARLGNIYKDTLMDSEGKITMKPERGSEEHQVVITEVENVIFPGQVEERKEYTTSENNTLLDFKATYSDTAGSPETQAESTDDLIVPFKLDEDFNYDNVVLTPKFSAQELQKLKQNMKSQTVVM